MNLTDMQRDSALSAPVGLAAARRTMRSGFPDRRVIEDAIV